MKRLFLLIFILFYLVSFSQNVTTNDRNSPHRLFDFWLGEWDVFSNDELVGHNTISLQQNGYLLQENWVDKNGSNLFLKGNFENDKMVLSSSADSNMGEAKSHHRISWTLMPNGDVIPISI